MAIAADSTTAEQAPDPVPHEPPQESRGSPDQPGHGEANEVDFEEEDGDAEELDGPAAYGERQRAVLRRLYGEPVGIRVHDIVIEGNFKTRDALIEAEVADLLRSAGTVQDLLRASTLASALLRRLDVFESVCITLDAGPPELPGTANVLIEVVEAATVGGLNFGYYSRAQARSGSLELSLKLRNLFGYGDIWKASGAYGWHQSPELGIGVCLPRLKSIPTPLTARASVLSQDWLELSSYKERLLGLSFGLLSTRHHDLSYDLTGRTLSDPSQMASKSEFDVRGAVPFGFYNAALNLGISAGVILPLGRGFMELSSPVPDRFYLGGRSSPVCSLGRLSSLLGFETRGVGPSEPRRFVPSGSATDDSAASPGRDYLGGDLAVSAFADLSFDLPIKLFKDTGIHGHAFLSAGNLAKLSESEYKNFSFPEFRRTFRSSAGIGIVLPTNLFRLEINYCYILKKREHDRGGTGIQFSISVP
ncbi:hypothetical protein QYE76_055803 [Lolium multiflorum]|uniref:Bacterial surface antigen (D15) domain-containing protein n=1 Tax=Lolium multiflorum TaxID=4521 RepID=A0AAD8WM86_LOLMU|nr:hypothetical protein QYE76_055803 [Lolium multiflorum]